MLNVFQLLHHETKRTDNINEARNDSLSPRALSFDLFCCEFPDFIQISLFGMKPVRVSLPTLKTINHFLMQIDFSMFFIFILYFVCVEQKKTQQQSVSETINIDNAMLFQILELIIDDAFLKYFNNAVKEYSFGITLKQMR